MDCQNAFICRGCGQTLHSRTPKIQQLLEHEERKQTIERYHDGEELEELVEVCENCFRKVMGIMEKMTSEEKNEKMRTRNTIDPP
jgi:K+/H+ antiporter YhaU regulatory subunit KhtT